MMMRIALALFLLLLISTGFSAFAAPVPPSPENNVTTIYEDIIVLQPAPVQRKASIAVGSRISMDFSGGPQSRTRATFTGEYGLSANWNLGAYFTPLYVTKDRPIRGAVQKLKLENGDLADLSYSVPKLSYGLETLWFVSYGKDVWFEKSLIRSDTFLRFSAGQTQFEGAKSGMDYGVSLGKTYYLGRSLNLRLAAGLGYNASIFQGSSKSDLIGLLDGGLTWVF